MGKFCESKVYLNLNNILYPNSILRIWILIFKSSELFLVLRTFSTHEVVEPKIIQSF